MAPPSLATPPGPAAPPAAAPLPGPPPAKPQEKVMATVSFIQPSVEDAFMEELLGAFGAIKSWRRPRDPKTNAPKSFGFVEYAHPESMTLALKVRLARAAVSCTLRAVDGALDSDRQHRPCFALRQRHPCRGPRST